MNKKTKKAIKSTVKATQGFATVSGVIVGGTILACGTVQTLSKLYVKMYYNN